MIYLLLLLLIATIHGKPYEKDQHISCGYQSCHKTERDKLNVHLIPHSHDDVGWLKTVDQYYYGLNRTINWSGVQYIIGSVVEALDENPDRRFIQVETAFFWQWWKKQTEKNKNLVKKLVNNGQLEIINGAWSMNDEAAAHYQSIIDQFTWGLKTINETLGDCGKPKIGWQIDPFGHSNEMASIFAQLGYEAVFFARLDYRDKAKRIKEKSLELIWQGSKNLGSSTNLFTSILTDFYNAPLYFCWDVLCTDEPIVDDKSSPEYNVEERVKAFANYVKSHAERFRTNNILIPMGGDFTYQASEMYFANMDKLIEGFKLFQPDMNVIYSTPSCYLKAVNDAAKEKNVAFPLKTDDFFPYASDKNSYWTGYYTSRPNSKRIERTGNNILQITKQIVSFNKINGSDYTSNITLLKEAMGIMQHHDAITGTEKQHVAQDYARIVTKAIETAESHISEMAVDLLKKKRNEDVSDVKINFSSCLLSNVTHCPNSNENRFVASVYNPLSRDVSHYIRLPVNGTNFAITGPNGETVDFDILPVINNFNYVQNIKPSTHELVFLAQNIPALGLQYYYITRQTSDVSIKPGQEVSFGNEKIGFTIDKATGLLNSVKIDGKSLSITQEFHYYNGRNGTNGNNTENRASGAYIFRPTTKQSLPFSTKVDFKSFKGKLVDEVHQTVNSWIKQIIRVYKTENHIEFDWLVGPTELINNLGVEVITRFTTSLDTKNTFYTDSNGKDLVKRVKNYRETYPYTDEEPVAGNYYPITSRIVLKDDKQNLELAILADRAQGGSSLDNGVLELMIHRHLLCDDDFGVAEALAETEFGQNVVVRGQHFLTFGSIKEEKGINSAVYQKDVVQRKLLSPWVFTGSATSENHTLEKLKEKLNLQFAGLKKSLPQNIQILTLEPWDTNTLLLRLEHLFEKDEHSTFSKETTIDLRDLFTLFEITSINETTIAANRWISEGRRTFEWNISSTTELYKDDDNAAAIFEDVENFQITLAPTQIRTFIITYEANSDTEKGTGSTRQPLFLAIIIILTIHLIIA